MNFEVVSKCIIIGGEHVSPSLKQGTGWLSELLDGFGTLDLFSMCAGGGVLFIDTLLRLRQT